MTVSKTIQTVQRNIAERVFNALLTTGALDLRAYGTAESNKALIRVIEEAVWPKGGTLTDG
jgi:hypothetical protein